MHKSTSLWKQAKPKHNMVYDPLLIATFHSYTYIIWRKSKCILLLSPWSFPKIHMAYIQMVSMVRKNAAETISTYSRIALSPFNIVTVK